MRGYYDISKLLEELGVIDSTEPGVDSSLPRCRISIPSLSAENGIPPTEHVLWIAAMALLCGM